MVESPEEFYAGKALTLMHVTGPGGTMDLASLLAIDYMTRYLPEGTEIVLEHRGGGGGIVGTNFAYNAAPKDGIYFFMPTPSLVPLTFARPDEALYDPSELQPLGRVLDSPRVFVSRADSGIETFEELMEQPVTHPTLPPGRTAWTVATAPAPRAARPAPPPSRTRSISTSQPTSAIFTAPRSPFGRRITGRSCCCSGRSPI